MSSNFEYYERRTSDRQDMVSCYTLQDYPPELQKKITLLLHFKSYLDDQKTNGNNVKKNQIKFIIY